MGIQDSESAYLRSDPSHGHFRLIIPSRTNPVTYRIIALVAGSHLSPQSRIASNTGPSELPFSVRR